MPDFSVHKLGKLAPKHDVKRLKLEKYLPLAEPPEEVHWGAGISDWGMLGNDRLGDCTIASVAHAVQLDMHEVGLPWDDSVGQDEVLKYYQQWCGYNPTDPATDQGAAEVDVLNSWRKDGFSGHKLIAYADPNVENSLHVKQSIALFGGLYIGLNLPFSAATQGEWEVVGDGKTGDSAPGSWGGHAVYVIGYDAGYLTCITWGQSLRMSWSFFQTYCDEAHTLFQDTWMKKETAPSGFLWADLEADLQQIVG